MIDIAVLIREYLLLQDPVISLLGTNLNSSIYAAVDLPEHFAPRLGAAIQLSRSGGIANPEITPLVTARLLLRIWADQDQYQRVSDVYGAVRDSLHGASNIKL